MSSGHANTAEFGQDILCSAISSSLFLVANTITEIYKLNPKLEVRDGYFSLLLDLHGAEICQPVLGGLLLHLNSLESDYSQKIKVMNILAEE